MRAVNPLVADAGAPPIPEAQGWARAYGGGRGPLVDLSQAAPGTAPPEEFLARLAASAGAAAGAKYGPIEGDDALREAYAADVSATCGGRVDPADVAITAGCNMAFVAAMMLLARHGDAVILPTPWYFNHQMILGMLGIEPRALPCRPEAGFVPDPAEAEALIDERTRAIVLVTPNNPTGAVYPPAAVEAFAHLARRRGLLLVLDETYRDFLPEGTARAHGLFAGGEWRSVLVQLYSFSKSYAIPGHRTGAVVADRGLVGELAKVLDCLQICPPRAAQGALPWAIGALRPWREANRAAINRRADAFRAALAPLPGWRIDSAGAYFAYLRHPFEHRPGRAVAERLAVERGILALPGSFFGPGQDRHLRVAFANVGEAVLAGLTERLEGFSL